MGPCQCLLHGACLCPCAPGITGEDNKATQVKRRTYAGIPPCFVARTNHAAHRGSAAQMLQHAAP